MGQPSPSHRVRRRVFLSALGLGLTASAASRLARVALAQATPAPKRFMLFYVPHGVPLEHFAPQVMPNDPTSFALNQTGESILGPLQDQFKQYTTVVQGLKYPQGAMTHEAIVVALSGLGGPNATTLPDDSVARTTLEHQIAAGLNTKPLILGACAHRPFGLDKDGKLMWDGTAVVPEKSPLSAYDTVFGGIQSAPMTGPDPNVALTDALHSLTESELEALSGELSSLTAEQTKLKLHLDAIRALKAAGSSAPVVKCDAAPVLDGVEAVRKAAAGQSDDFFLKEENFPKLLTAQLQLAGAALRCNARQVVAVQPMYANCDFDFGFMGEKGAHHSTLSHTSPQPDDYPATTLKTSTRASFARCQRWFYQQLVTHALTPLLQPDPADPSKKVIDNTIVYVTSEIGDDAWHTTKTTPIQLGATPNGIAYLPSVIIGGGGGALKAGQVQTFATDRAAGDLYRALCQAMGAPGKFPDSTGAMSEVLA